MPAAAVAFLVVLLDQLSKLWAKRHLSVDQPLPVIEKIFELKLVYNPGAAFGIFAHQRTFLIFLSAACLIAIIIFYSRLSKKTFWCHLGVGLLCGGIIGVLLDRVRDGVVTDFLHFSLPPFSILFQTFNLADAAIFFGVIILLCRIFKGKRQD